MSTSSQLFPHSLLTRATATTTALTLSVLAAPLVAPHTTLLAAPYVSAQEETPATTTSSKRKKAPNTDDCPHANHPGEPVTTSERLAPGQPTPTPIPAVVSDLPCGQTTPPGFKVDKKVIASSWLVADVNTGEIIAMKDPHGRYRPASVIKVLLALVAIEELDLNTIVVGTQEDADTHGSSVGIGPGGKYRVKTLLHGLLMGSGNDAAHALARQLGGDEETLKKINAKARELGAVSTYAASYSGLDAAGMQTSVYDLGLMYQEAYSNKTFHSIVNTEKIKFPGYGDLEGYELWNDNKLFLFDPDGMGGKTGFTDDANHTFVGALNRDGRELMAIILDTTIDSEARPWQQAQMLLHEAYKVPEGKAVTQLDKDYRAQEAESQTTSPSPASELSRLPESEDATLSPEVVNTAGSELIQRVQPWLGWVVLAITIALAVLLGAAGLRKK